MFLSISLISSIIQPPHATQLCLVYACHGVAKGGGARKSFAAAVYPAVVAEKGKQIVVQLSGQAAAKSTKKNGVKYKQVKGLGLADYPGITEVKFCRWFNGVCKCVSPCPICGQANSSYRYDTPRCRAKLNAVGFLNPNNA